MIEFERRNGERWEIVSSGAISIPRDAIAFQLPYEGLHFRFNFVVDDDDEHSIKVDSIEGASIVFNVTGFNNPQGTAWETRVATVDDAEIRLSLYITAVRPAGSEVRPRQITYSFSRKVI